MNSDTSVSWGISEINPETIARNDLATVLLSWQSICKKHMQVLPSCSYPQINCPLQIPKIIKHVASFDVFVFDDYVIGVGDAFRNWIELHPSGAVKVYKNIDVISGYAQVVARSDLRPKNIDKRNIFKEFCIRIPNLN